MANDAAGRRTPADDTLDEAASERSALPPIVRAATPRDAPAVAAILNREIAETTATWTSTPKTDAEIAALIAARIEAGYDVLVAAAEGEPAVGYAALGPFRRGEGYASCAEAAVYVAAAMRGRGLGGALLDALVRRGRRRGFAALIACVGADNGGSLALFQRGGFAEAGRLPGIGRKFGRALDLVILRRGL